MKGFSIIVAMDSERGIGKDGRIPWDFPEDMRYFKKITLGHGEGKPNAVIMGRKTWESLPARFRPLPGRKNAVISSNRSYNVPQSVLLFSGLEEALAYFCVDRSDEYGDIFVIGGAKVYKDAINHAYCRNLYLTIVDKNFKCDTFFPEIPLFFRKGGCQEICENAGTVLSFQMLIKESLPAQ